MKKIAITIFVALLSTTAPAQQYVQDFTLTNVMDGSSVTLSGYSKPVVAIFTSNECAFDSYYTARIKSLIDNYGSKVQFILINAGVEANDSEDKMVAKCKSWNFGVPYLSDKNQNVMTALNVRKSPDVILLNKSGGKFFIAYRGAIDDNPQVATDVKQAYLKLSLDKVLASQKIDVTETRMAGGCTIRRK